MDPEEAVRNMHESEKEALSKKLIDALWDPEAQIVASVPQNPCMTVPVRHRGTSYDEVIQNLERLIITICPDDNLPLLIDRDWYSDENAEYYKKRLQNARVQV